MTTPLTNAKKTRTSSSIPLMRGPSGGTSGTSGMGSTSTIPNATLPTNNPALPATHIVASVRSDKLEEEASRMESRLAQLKVAMTTEKAQRAALKKTKQGSFWKAAEPPQEGKQYMEDVMKRVERRVAKAQQQGFATPAATAAPTNPTNSTAAPRSSTNTSNIKSDLSSTQKSSYVPPVQPKSSVSAPSAPRVQGSNVPASNSSATTNPASATATSNGAISARKAGASTGTITPSPGSLLAAASSQSSSVSYSNSFVNPADDDNRSGAPGSLLDGDFDEQENKQWFAQAREEWIAATKGEAPTSGGAASTQKPRTQLVHDPDYTPAIQASPSPNGVSGGGSSLLDGPAFNEKESAKDFAEARKAWIMSLANENSTAGGSSSTSLKHHRPAETAQEASLHSQEDSMWNPSIALGTGGGILFPSESDDAHSTAAPSTARVNPALRQAQQGLEKQSKASCYQCYKLFYASSNQTSSFFPQRTFCSVDCVTKSESQEKLRCHAAGCAKSFLCKDASIIENEKGEKHAYCESCGKNGGIFVKPSAVPTPAAAPTPAVPSPSQSTLAVGGFDSLTSSLDSIPHASSPEIDEPDAGRHQSTDETESHSYEGSLEDIGASDEVNSGGTEAMKPAPDSTMDASRTGSAASQSPYQAHPSQLLAFSSRPASAAPTQPQVKLDTSVIHRAATTATAAAAVVEFPSDNEEGE